MPLLGIRSLRTIIIRGIMQEFQNEDRIIAYKSGRLVSLCIIHLSRCAFTGLLNVSHTNQNEEASSTIMLKIFRLWFWKYKKWILVWITKLFKETRLNGLIRGKDPQVLSKTWGVTSFPCVDKKGFCFLSRQVQVTAFCGTWTFSVGSWFALSFLQTLDSRELLEREGGSPPVWKSINLLKDCRKRLRWIRVDKLHCHLLGSRNFYCSGFVDW